MTPADARQHFLRIASLPDERIDLAEAALFVAAEEYAELDVAAALATLDALADAARGYVERAAGSRSRASCTRPRASAATAATTTTRATAT